MTNSRSRASRRSSLIAALVVGCAILGLAAVAQADRKRVVVLDFDGPKGGRFHDDLVKLIKRTHTIVPTAGWNRAADELDASAVSDTNVKMVARRLKIDAIVEGTIEKRRSEFIVRLTLREGKTGEQVGTAIDVKAAGPRLDSRAQRELKDELIGAIGSVEANRDDEDERPAKKTARKTDDEEDRPAKKTARKTDDEDDRPAKKTARKTDDEEDRPAKKAARKADDRPAAKKAGHKPDDEVDDAGPSESKVAPTTDGRAASRGSSKHGDDERGSERADKKTARPADGEDAAKPERTSAAPTDDEAAPPARKADRRVASREDGGDAEVNATAGEPVPAAAASPGERALDVVVGLSVTARQLAFQPRAGFTTPPPAYKGTPVPGAMLDATLYPFAVGHTRGGVLKNLGLDVMYDRAISITTKDAAGKQYATKETRFGIAGVVRYPFGRTATSPVVLATLGYASQLFSIDAGTTIGIPSVKYSIFEPGVGLRLPLTSRMIASLDAKVMLVTDTGQIQDAMQYGPASVLGFEGALGFDVLLTRSVFARAAFRYETIGYTFQGTGTLSNASDGDPMTIDVPGARDSYIGGLVTVGYVY